VLYSFIDKVDTAQLNTKWNAQVQIKCNILTSKVTKTEQLTEK